MFLLSQKKKGVILHHNNVRPHTALLTKDLLEKVGWLVEFYSKIWDILC